MKAENLVNTQIEDLYWEWIDFLDYTVTVKVREESKIMKHKDGTFTRVLYSKASSKPIILLLDPGATQLITDKVLERLRDDEKTKKELFRRGYRCQGEIDTVTLSENQLCFTYRWYIDGFSIRWLDEEEIHPPGGSRYANR